MATENVTPISTARTPKARKAMPPEGPLSPSAVAARLQDAIFSLNQCDALLAVSIATLREQDVENDGQVADVLDLSAYTELNNARLTLNAVITKINGKEVQS